MPNHIQNRLHVTGAPEKVKALFASIVGKYKDGTKMYIDFNAIVKMPDGMNVTSSSNIEMWVNILNGNINFKAVINSTRKNSSFGEAWINEGFDNMINMMQGTTALEALMEGKRTIKDFDDKMFEEFLQTLRNYRTTGFMNWHDWSQKNWGTKWNAYEQKFKKDKIYFQTAWSAPIDLMIKLSEMHPEVTLNFDYADEDSGSNCGKMIIIGGKIQSREQPASQSKAAYDIYFELHPGRKKDFKLVGNTYEYVEEED